MARSSAQKLHKTIMKIYGFLFLISTFLVGCSLSPRYETTYELRPPSDLRGRECINQCQTPLEICETNQNASYQACMYQSSQKYLLCKMSEKFEIDKQSGKSRCVSSCGCYQEWCQKPEGEAGICQERYRQCYALCGGTVIPTTRCVARCDAK